MPERTASPPSAVKVKCGPTPSPSRTVSSVHINKQPLLQGALFPKLQENNLQWRLDMSRSRELQNGGIVIIIHELT